MASGHLPVSKCSCAPSRSHLGGGGRAGYYPSCEGRAGTPWDYAALPRVWCALMCHRGMSQILPHWQGQKAPQTEGVLACRQTVISCPGLALQYYLNLVFSRNVAFANDYFARRRIPFSPLPFMLLQFSENSYPFWSTPASKGGPNLLLSNIFVF